jgi:hypothetical protein
MFLSHDFCSFECSCCSFETNNRCSFHAIVVPLSVVVVHLKGETVVPLA